MVNPPQAAATGHQYRLVNPTQPPKLPHPDFVAVDIMSRI